MPRVTGGRAVVEQLEREGVYVVFGIPGVHTLELHDALIDSPIRQVTARHEQGAGFMADGYARATGRVGVLLAITGPGVTNAATAIAQAYSDSSPLLVVSSANETNRADQGRGLLHELKDQRQVMDGIAAYSQRVTRVADVPGAVADAFEYVETHRPRPVHLELPTDVLERADDVEPADRERPSSPPSADGTRIDDAVDRLRSADAPLLLVGGGAAGAAPLVRRFVERTGIPVATTVAGKGIVPPDHDLALGATLRDEAVADYVASRDAVLAVGTELSPVDTGGIDLPGTLIHVDVDYETIGRNHPTALGIVADAEPALRALLERVGERGVHLGNERPESGDAPWTAHEMTADDDRHRILAVLRGALDEDAVVVNDMTKLCYEARRRFPTGVPGTFLFPQGYGTLGFSPPAAYGAAIGLDDRQVVSLVGDGGFMFTVQELSTAVRYDVGIPVVVLNDDAYGVIEDFQTREYDGRTTGTELENPDFVELARAVGAAGRRIEMGEIDDALPTALEEAFARDRPTVVEVPVDFPSHAG